MSSPSEVPSTIFISALLFAASVGWFLRAQTELKKNGKPKAALLPRGKIGSRGENALSPLLPYMKGFFRCLGDMCDPIHNPKGHIGLCVAENKLITEILAERFMQPGTATAAFSDSIVYGYNSFLGLSIARDAVAYFLAKRFYRPDQAATMTPQMALSLIDPEHIAIGSGCAGILNQLFFSLGEDGDACLIPAPYYAAFEKDMSVMAGCVPFAVHMANPALGPTAQELDLAYIEAQSKGLRVNFLLLTNPNNPLGVIYKPEVIDSAVKWARKRGLHTIVDEIYAMSTHKKHGHGFQSVIRVLDNKLGDDVHMVWAVSKDFGSSGWRLGVLYSQNELLIKSLANLSIFSCVSQPVQMMTAELLTDDAFVDSFLDESRDRLRNSYQICTSKLEEMVIPFVPAEAGLFVYVDFSSLLPAKTFEYEAQLSDLFLEHAKLVLTPGSSQRDASPGMFRICYAWVSVEVLELAMERLSRLVVKIRKMEWDDLNANTLNGII